MLAYEVRDIAYESPYGGQVPTYLVVPSGNGPFPAVVFLHPGQGNRSTFLSEAEALAEKGVVSLLIDAPFVRGEAPSDMTEEQRMGLMIRTVTDVRMMQQAVVDVQSGIDLLSGLDFVDSQRIAYVGHSFGATWGGMLAGVEPRIKALVLMAGFSRVSEWHRASGHPLAALIRQALPQERFEQFVAELEPLDAVHYVGNASAPLLLQFAQQDDFVSKEQAENYIAAASEPKEVKWYDANHLFTGCEAAYQDRVEWVLKQVTK